MTSCLTSDNITNITNLTIGRHYGTETTTDNP